jgi:hypothetical protein
MKKIVFMSYMVLSLLIAVSASADPITYDVSIPNDTLFPYSGPYATLTVNLDNSNQATITMTAMQGYAIDGNNAFDLNTNGAVSISRLTDGFSQVVPKNDKENNVSEFGTFNLIFDGGNGFSKPYFEVSVVLTSSLERGWSSASDVLAPNDKGYIAAGHFGVPSSSIADIIKYEDTGFAGVGTPVPEPATMFLLGFGLIGMGVFVRRKFKR